MGSQSIGTAERLNWTKHMRGVGFPWSVKRLICCFAVSSLALFSALNKGFPDSSVGKEFTCNAEDPGSIPGSGRSAGEGKATHSSIVAWRIPLDSVVHGVAKSQTPLSDLLSINSFPSELLLCSFLHLFFFNLFILLHLFLLVCFSVLHSGHFLLISLSCHQLSLHLCLLQCYPSKKFLVSMALIFKSGNFNGLFWFFCCSLLNFSIFSCNLWKTLIILTCWSVLYKAS